MKVFSVRTAWGSLSVYMREELGVRVLVGSDGAEEF